MIEQKLWQFFVACSLSLIVGGLAYLIAPKPFGLGYDIVTHLLVGIFVGSAANYVILGKTFYPSRLGKWDVAILGFMSLVAAGLLTRFILDYWSLCSGIEILSEDYAKKLTDATTRVGLCLGIEIRFLCDFVFGLSQIVKRKRLEENVDTRAPQPWH